MKKRLAAWMLVLALGGSLLATAAFAGDKADDTVTAEAQTGTAAETPADPAEKAAQDARITGEATAPVAGEGITTGGYNPELSVRQPDPVGQLSFANLEKQVRENNLSVLALEETIQSVEATDYSKLRSELEDQLDSLEDMSDGIGALMQGLGTVEVGPDGGFTMVQDANDRLTQLLAGYVLGTLSSSKESLEDAIADIRSGMTQKKAADGIRQLENGQDQYVIAAESLYVTVLELQNTKAGLERSLEAMDRTVQEMELRYSMGQISALQLQQVKSGRVQLRSGLDTLCSSMESAVVQLEMMVGAEITGKMTVTEVPDVTDAQVDAISYEADLDEARQKSYDLYATRAALENAEEEYKDAKSDYAKNTYQRKSAEHKWQAAQYNYEAAVQSYEAKFRACCGAVKDYRQILKAKENALDLQEATFRSVELKYQQGTVSQNDYLTARDELESARDAVTTAKHDLFTAYRTYVWAVRFGVLN